MNQPSIECRGVYVVPCDDAAWREGLDSCYRTLGLFDQTADYRRRVFPIVLIEVVVSWAAPSFDVGQFRQTMEKAPDGYDQVAYDEALLSHDGTAIVEQRQGCADGIAGGRIAFFLHYYDPTRPIQWSFGEFACPPPLPMPERLSKLMSYRPT